MLSPLDIAKAYPVPVPMQRDFNPEIAPFNAAVPNLVKTCCL